jgi:hypothetical protein
MKAPLLNEVSRFEESIKAIDKGLKINPNKIQLHMLSDCANC